MDLLDRYIAAISRALPAVHRDDIAEEIRSTLQDTLDDRASALGRALSDDEIVSVIKEYGHPRLVAARYAGDDMLIGPMLMPFYWPSLKVAVIAALAAEVLLKIIREILTGSGDIVQYIATLWTGAVTTFVLVVGTLTIVFAIFQRLQTRLGSQWDPRKLQRLDNGRTLKRWTLCMDLGLNLFLAGFFFVILRPLANIHDAAIPFALTPAWQSYIIPAIAVFMIGVAIDIVNLCYPAWTRLRAATRIIMHLITVAIGVAFLLLRNIVTLAANAPHTKELTNSTAALNDIALAGFFILALIAAFAAYGELKRFRDAAEPVAC